MNFNRFPNDPTLKRQWLKAMKGANGHYHLRKGDVICSQHFKRKCYHLGGGKFSLKKDAVPTIFHESKSIRPLDITSDETDETSSSEAFEECIVFDLEDEEHEDVEYVEEEGVKEVEYVEDEEVKEEVEYVEDEGVKEDVEYEICYANPPEPTKQPHFVGDFMYEDLEDPVQRRKFWWMSQRVIDDQSRKIQYYCGRIRELEKQTERLQKRLDGLPEVEIIDVNSGKQSQRLIFTPKKQYL